MADDRRDDNKGHHARPAASADEPETAAPADKRQCHDRDELSVAAGLHGCSIPIFIWEHVFSFLSTRDAAVASLVCWDWRGIWESAPFWADGRFLFIKHEHLPYLARNFNVCRHIQHISVSGSVADYDGVGKYQQIPPFEKYVSALPRQIAPYFRPGSFANLVSLSTEIPLVKEDMEFLATNAPNLKVLDVLDHDVGHFFDGGECDTGIFSSFDFFDKSFRSRVQSHSLSAEFSRTGDSRDCGAE